MEASELRLGNFIAVYGTIGKPDGWRILQANAEHIQQCVKSPEKFQPCPILRNILIECGFSQAKSAFYFCGVEVFFRDSKAEVSLGIGSHYEDPEKLDHIKYIHQLQNLWFAIYGEELIK